jgi:hypothetical protein
MQGGRKKDPRAVKAARGTVQPCRDGRTVTAVAIVEAPTLRLVPPEMPMEVADVWAEYHDPAVSNGVKQCDAEAYAEWCTMAAFLRKARNAEESAPAPASYIAQFRMLGELLGLAGPGSRVVSKGVEAAKSNPFARNGRRN